MTKNLQFYMFLSKSFYKSESPKKLWHKNNIKKITQGIFQFFCQIGDPDFGINPGFGIHLLQTNWYSKIGVLLYFENST